MSVVEFVISKDPIFLRSGLINGCYDLKLGSGCNLGKDLSKSGGKSQLVKYKDIGLYLQYIPIDNEVEAW